jgi:glycosyltransferase involved in cell wall biosynthesis
MRVLVVMSTWNGMAYIKPQIASILAQDFDGQLDVLVRDDGSQDETAAFLAAYDSDRIRVIRGENIGTKASFLELLRIARDEDVDFVALADQDDVWDADKISHAVARLNTSTPTLYCSAVRLVDENLNVIGFFHHPGDRSLVSTLFHNCATGCTCVINRALLDLLPQPPNPQRIIMHDWWLASVAAACGRIEYDDHAHIAYRQHSANQVGMRTGRMAVIQHIFKVLSSPVGTNRVTQAQELVSACGAMLAPKDARDLREYLDLSRTHFGRATLVWRQKHWVRRLAAILYVLRS